MRIRLESIYPSIQKWWTTRASFCSSLGTRRVASSAAPRHSAPGSPLQQREPLNDGFAPTTVGPTGPASRRESFTWGSSSAPDSPCTEVDGSPRKPSRCRQTSSPRTASRCDGSTVTAAVEGHQTPQFIHVGTRRWTPFPQPLPTETHAGRPKRFASKGPAEASQPSIRRSQHDLRGPPPGNTTLSTAHAARLFLHRLSRLQPHSAVRLAPRIPHPFKRSLGNQIS